MKRKLLLVAAIVGLLPFAANAEHKNADAAMHKNADAAMHKNAANAMHKNADAATPSRERGKNNNIEPEDDYWGY